MSVSSNQSSPEQSLEVRFELDLVNIFNLIIHIILGNICNIIYYSNEILANSADVNSCLKDNCFCYLSQFDKEINMLGMHQKFLMLMFELILVWCFNY